MLKERFFLDNKFRGTFHGTNLTDLVILNHSRTSEHIVKVTTKHIWKITLYKIEMMFVGFVDGVGRRPAITSQGE